ncbi:zinc ribbon domain-containing protein [Desulfovibrio sp. TomC]|uniref:zinc ribbon domain-containing protein n=1 Tax=Desulfovibrio sp. TomC TaxID=1562888 RepID=UPI000573766E|nr:zinc ribbon domain-containing protein [Desulfovibrio sp. TomC]KHK03071.1 hypothetical protein NY78_1600 [Desulfovibrio sp. TomC]
MHCNKCGSDNPDDRRVCALCGHKLQSGRGGGEDGDGDGVEAPISGTGSPGQLPRPTDQADGSRPGTPDSRTGHPEVASGSETQRQNSRLLDFQGWTSPLRGLGPYVEACLYAGVLAVAVTACLLTGVLWPLYPLLALLAAAAWLRRL